MSDPSGKGFDPSHLAAAVVDFYEQTADWRLEVWSRWSPGAWPVGWLLSTLFRQRLQQLSLPLHPLDAAHGMDSRIVTMLDRNGAQLGAAWFRTLRSTRQTVYSGYYGIARLPKAERPSIRVVFPLPNGSLTVFLRPEEGTDGALILDSPIGAFGDDGACLVVAEAHGQSGWAKRVPLLERFAVQLDDEGTLRADHALSLMRASMIRFHYRMERQHAA